MDTNAINGSNMYVCMGMYMDMHVHMHVYIHMYMNIVAMYFLSCSGLIELLYIVGL